MNATSVAEVKKSRSVSNSRSVLAKAPADWGRYANCMSSTWSKIRQARMTSARLPAKSTNTARKVRIRKSNTNTVMTPIARTQPVSMALLGSTRS